MIQFAGFSGVTHIPGAGYFCGHASAHTRAHSLVPSFKYNSYALFTNYEMVSSCSIFVPRGPSVLFYTSLWSTQSPMHSIHQTADHHFFHPPPRTQLSELMEFSTKNNLYTNYPGEDYEETVPRNGYVILRACCAVIFVVSLKIIQMKPRQYETGRTMKCVKIY